MLTNQKSIYYFRLFLDIILLIISFVLAASISQSVDILLSRTYMFVLLAILIFVWYFFSNVIGFYEDFYSRDFSYQFINIIKNISTQFISIIVFIFFVKEDLFTRNFIIIYSVLLFAFVSIRIELVKFFLIKIGGSKKNKRNLLIVGTGEAAKNFSELINDREDFGFKFTGFITFEKQLEANQVLGTVDNLSDLIVKHQIEVVVIALASNDSVIISRIFNICNKHAVRVHIIPDYINLFPSKYSIAMIGNIPIITLRREPLSEAHWRLIKRSTDVFLAIFGIVFILSWLFPIIYILNKFFSPGPVLFIQDRIGTNNEIFKCYKFRTMHYKSGLEDKFLPTVEGDKRVTKLGSFLRKSNLDELPQLINVLKGEMSIVGPRPHPISFHNVYTQMVEEIKLRGWVKPGITGWAQVHGYRGDVLDFEENKKRTKKRIEHDIWYIENWSIWLDIQIILLTIWQMLKRDTKAV